MTVRLIVFLLTCVFCRSIATENPTFPEGSNCSEWCIGGRSPREHEMTIPIRVNVQNDQMTAKAKFTVPYVAWGMKDPSNLVLRVDKSVDVEVVLIGTLLARSQASARRRLSGLSGCSTSMSALHF
jgi:hypothetical protein